MRSSHSVDRVPSTASGGNFKCDPPLPPASSAFPSPPFSLSPLHACAGAPPLPLSPRAPPPEQVDRDDRSSPTVELLSPGSSFCWGPELQGSTSPSSSRSSTQRRAGRDRHEVRRARGPAPPARAPATPPASRTGPAPSRRLAPLTPRLHAALAPHPFILYTSVRRCSMPPRPRCRLAPDAATPPMPPRSRCRLAPRCRHAPDAATLPMPPRPPMPPPMQPRPPLLPPMPPPMPPRPDAIPDASFPPFIKHSYFFFFAMRVSFFLCGGSSRLAGPAQYLF